MSQQSISNSLLNIVLIVAESVLTLILRFDSNLRQTVYPLAKQNVCVQIRTYLPHLEFYATFSPKGVLLDLNSPSSHKSADLVINVYMHQLLTALVSNDLESINKIPMRGEQSIINEVRLFFVQLGMASLLQSIIKIIKGDKNQHKHNDSSKNSTEVAEIKEKIEIQKQKINTLTVNNRKLEMQLKEEQNRRKTMFIGMCVSILITLIMSVVLFVYIN